MDEERISGPVVIPMDTVKPESVEWIWPAKIARSKVNTLFGDPGGGKTMVALDIAARVSRGVSWPDLRDEDNPAGDVIILSAEDDLGDTIRPRLDAAGAATERIKALTAVRHIDPVDGQRDVPFSLDTDLTILGQVLTDTPDAKLIIIDPISAYLGGRIDSHKNSDVRALLFPLAQLAAERRVAVLCISHLNKGAGGSALYRMTGSLAFVAAARTAWLVTRDPQDQRRRLLTNAKSNIGPESDGLAFTIEQTEEGVARVAWEVGIVEMRADQALAMGGQDRSERDEVKEWLRHVMGQSELEASVVKSMATKEGFSAATLRRAKEELHVAYRREGFGKDCKTFWHLNGDTGAHR